MEPVIYPQIYLLSVCLSNTKHPIMKHVISLAVQPLIRGQLMMIRPTSKETVKFCLVDSTIGLGVAAEFGSWVTSSQHIAVILEDLFAGTVRRRSLTNTRVWALGPHEKKTRVVWDSYIFLVLQIILQNILMKCLLPLTSWVDVMCRPADKDLSSLRTKEFFCVWIRVEEKEWLWATGAERPRCRIWSMDWWTDKHKGVLNRKTNDKITIEMVTGLSSMAYCTNIGSLCW